eukprot:2525388-Prymnesium_polylepis.1
MRYKVKAVVGLYQCMSAVPSVFNVETPPGLEHWTLVSIFWFHSRASALTAGWRPFKTAIRTHVTVRSLRLLQTLVVCLARAHRLPAHCGLCSRRVGVGLGCGLQKFSCRSTERANSSRSRAATKRAARVGFDIRVGTKYRNHNLQDIQGVQNAASLRTASLR